MQNFNSKLPLLMVPCALCAAITPTLAKSPNIIFIMTDQQSNSAMSYMGNENLKTPNLDKLAKSGYAFTQSYCSNPVSLPSRFTLVTGYYPTEIGVTSNGDVDKAIYDANIERARSSSAANSLTAAGYETYYGGKVHLPGGTPLTGAEEYGFDNVISIDVRNKLTDAAMELINSRKSDDKPMYLFLSYLNPHDICEYNAFCRAKKWPNDLKAFKQEKYDNAKLFYDKAKSYPEDKFYNEMCAALPTNMALPNDYVLASNAPAYYAKNKNEWKLRQWIYDRMMEQADVEIGRVMATLRASDIWDNTIVVFTSDHGDMQGGHSFVNKPFPFQEDQLVPLIFAGGAIKNGVLDKKTNVSGIDVVPTILDFAGANDKIKRPGVSLKSLITGDSKKLAPRYIITEGAETKSKKPLWRQAVSKDGRYKYTYVEDPEIGSLLVDLEKDPQELKNLINSKEHSAIKRELNNELNRLYPELIPRLK